MKYFIDPDNHWDLDGYWKSVPLLRNRLSKRVYSLITSHTFHDALVLSFAIKNVSKTKKRRFEDPTVVEAKVIDYMDDYEYTLQWSGVSKINFSYDKADKVYIDESGQRYNEKDYQSLESWNFDELLILDDTYLSHEIELHSGTRILIHFRKLDYKRSLKKVRL